MSIAPARAAALAGGGWANTYSLALDGATGLGTLAASGLGSTTDLSFACWVKPASLPLGGPDFCSTVLAILPPGGVVGNEINYHFRVGLSSRGDKGAGAVWGHGGYPTNGHYSTVPTQVDVWKHWFFTRAWDGDASQWTSRWYIDGVEDAGSPVVNAYTPVVAAGGTCYVGWWGNPQLRQDWDGKLDEIALWTVAATPAQAAEVYNGGEAFDLTTASLGAPQVYWRWEHDNTDSSGNGHSMPLVGGATYSEDVPG